MLPLRSRPSSEGVCLKNGHPAHVFTLKDRRKAAAVTNEIRREKRALFEQLRLNQEMDQMFAKDAARRERPAEKQRRWREQRQALDWNVHGRNGAGLVPGHVPRAQAWPRGAQKSWGGFHTFRHTCATTLFRSGLNAKQVQVWLGHHSPAFTLGTYVHFLDDDLPSADFLDGVTAGGNREATSPTGTPLRPVGDAEADSPPLAGESLGELRLV